MEARESLAGPYQGCWTVKEGAPSSRLPGIALAHLQLLAVHLAPPGLAVREATTGNHTKPRFSSDRL